jgi:hypothetical protein
MLRHGHLMPGDLDLPDFTVVTAAYVSISKAHDAITATEDLGKATAGLHRNLGLSVRRRRGGAGSRRRATSTTRR